MHYHEQLLTKEWKIKRSLIITRDDYCCTICNSSNRLQVHHKKYIYGRMAWDYPDALLQTLCRKCHIEIHKKETIKSEKDTDKIKKNKVVKIKPKIKVVKKKKGFTKLSIEDQRIQDKWDKIKNRPKRKY